jgi:choline kinase
MCLCGKHRRAGWASGKIQEVLESSSLTELLEIIYIDLGEHYNAGHARSLIKARRHLLGQGPFLLCTSDHIFDPRIVYELANIPLVDQPVRQRSADSAQSVGRYHSINTDVELGNDVATEERIRGVVLVENHFADMLESLPGTAVKVRYREEDGGIEEIGRHVTEFNGIEAGLFLLNSEIFETLIDLSADKLYFSLADALARLAEDGLLVARPTHGLHWTSVETPGQLEETQDMLDDEGGFRFVGPWDVRVVKLPQNTPSTSISEPESSADTAQGTGIATEAPRQSHPQQQPTPPLAPSSHYLLLGVPTAPGTHVHLLEGNSEESRQDFLVGFVVPVEQAALVSPITSPKPEARKGVGRSIAPRRVRKKKRENDNKACRSAMLLLMGTPPPPDAEDEKEDHYLASTQEHVRQGDEDEDVKLEDLQAAASYALAVPVKDMQDLHSREITLFFACGLVMRGTRSFSYIHLLSDANVSYTL